MKSLFDRIKERLGLVKPRPVEDSAELRAAFRRQYRNFRSLLTANNNALELMAEIEQALEGGRPFSMAFVRGHCTALGANVLKMITLLQALGGERYQRVLPPFRKITEELEKILNREPQVVGHKFVLPLAELDRHLADQVGEKMANLGEIRNRIGLPTPDGFVITAAATRHFFAFHDLMTEINRRITGLDRESVADVYAVAAAIEQLIVQAPLPADLEAEIFDHYIQLVGNHEEKPLVAMRSSALGEDSSRSSFAGMYRSRLNVDGPNLLHAYKEVVAGKYRPRAMTYRLQRGFNHQDIIMCVGCLVMVDGLVSGVMYSRPPDYARGEWVQISAAGGLADKVVSGRGAVRCFRVSRHPPHWLMVPESHDFNASEHFAVEFPAIGDDSPASESVEELLSREHLAELAAIAVRLEEHFGAPQDIEWSLGRDGRIYLLQSRPIGGVELSEAVEEVQRLKSPGNDAQSPLNGSAEGVLLRGGIGVAPGVGCGPVYKVHEESDLLRFPKGAVLVVVHPLPEWAVVLSRAAAVVSETGESAAHLATVAREFGIPAIFGLEGAASKLPTGMEITVDAVGLRVYDGRREDLLSLAPPPPKLMIGSPVHKVLSEASALIRPLNLLDPNSPFFRPSNCRTLHDITRYCHEKAVAEMFTFGSRHGFAAGAAKQLVVESPYNWWIIDLEDGFSPEHDLNDPFIRLEHIVSRPMLAIWEGMIAFPWKGPPPVNLRGFGSILFRSTMNPELVPAVRSNYKARSYFLISRNFCNLSIRLGYHFALVESHISDLRTENYVSFQFKGGAADDLRRLLRIELIAEVLEDYNFRVVRKEDTLTARLEKKEVPFLLKRLKVLGYLLIHTRQIDMVMEDRSMVDYYHRKTQADLEILLQQYM